MPARSLGSRSRRLRDPRDLEGIITSQIVHWRAFFILFHHFRCLKLFVLLKVSRTISLTYAAVRRPCDGRATAGRFTASMRLSIIPAHGAHAPWADAHLGHAQNSKKADEKLSNKSENLEFSRKIRQRWTGTRTV